MGDRVADVSRDGEPRAGHGSRPAKCACQRPARRSPDIDGDSHRQPRPHYLRLGIGLLISQSIIAFASLRYAGAAYLIYLGISSFRSRAETLETTVFRRRPPHRTWFVQGFLNNLLNPKGTLFYLGVFTTVISPNTSVNGTLLLIFVMMLVSASFWLFFVYTLDRPSVRDVIERSQQTVNRILGGLLLLLGLRMAFMRR